MSQYAELQVLTNFTFLEGGAHPEELVAQAAALGLTAIAVTDRNSLAGVVRAHQVAEDAGIKLIVGARLDVTDGPSILALMPDRETYARLSTLITLGRRRAPKGECHLTTADILERLPGARIIVLPETDETRAPTDGRAWFEDDAAPSSVRTESNSRALFEDDVAPPSVRAEPVEAPGPSTSSGRTEMGEAPVSGFSTFADAVSREPSLPRQNQAARPRSPARTEPNSRALSGDDAPPSPVRAEPVEAHPPSTRSGRTGMKSPSPGPASHTLKDALRRYRASFGDSVWLAATHRYQGTDNKRLKALADLSAGTGVPLIATNDVLYHTPERRSLQDVLTCIRHGVSIDEAGWRLAANAERHLKTPEEMTRLFRDYPEAIAETLRLAESCHFSLSELSYEYPDEILRHRSDPQEELEYLVEEGLKACYGATPPPRIREFVTGELALIRTLKYAPYFLTVHDIVRFARENGILCQGRGSAANSAVCYVLGITSVDPTRIDLLFERFISAERGEPPDIDVDFEHERREEVIQYIYEKYGRHRAALTATVITYRRRSAVRDIGKAMGLSLDVIDRLNNHAGGWRQKLTADYVKAEGFDPADRRLGLTLELAELLHRFPRHLSQHTGGFVISRRPLDEIVPIENAAMDDRTVIEWDKDDLEHLGLIKVDVLALGMLTCIRRAFDFLRTHYHLHHTLASIPPGDAPTYDMLCRADSIGVFQVESRAQMSMLPRLKPRTFYDLVIEVSIVRPGPIQGDMVHPYLRRRDGLEEVEYPSPELEKVLEKTLGVPLFQEQAMRIAMVAAGFTASEADQLRRAMAAFRRSGTIQNFRTRMIEGMRARGYEEDFAARCFNQIEGFGEYGFPESHAASFALLVYVSAWLKCHYPEVFAAALLNSQPMGFYAPAQIVRDAQAHGVEMRPVDINHSNWECTLEDSDGPHKALRLGFSRVKGLNKTDMERLVTARGSGYRSPLDVAHRTGLRKFVVERLAEADAFQSLGLDRRQAAWAVRRLEDAGDLPLFAGLADGAVRPEPALPAPSLGEHVVADYVTTHMSLKSHPTALLRERLDGEDVLPANRLPETPSGRRVTVGGIVLARQRPGTAKGVMFVTLEDETGVVNLVTFSSRMEAFRRPLLAARLMLCTGRLENKHGVIHVIADAIYDRSDWLQDLTPQHQTRQHQTRMSDVIERGRFFR